MASEGTVERTLVVIKPDGVKRGLIGEIVRRFEGKGLKIVALRFFQLTPELAARHYGEHEGKPFYNGLIQLITSGPVVALALEGRSAIQVVRAMTGATNPQTAAPGTIRGDLALAITSNLVHASDSAATAERELAAFFPPEAYCLYSRSDEGFQ